MASDYDSSNVLISLVSSSSFIAAATDTGFPLSTERQTVRETQCLSAVYFHQVVEAKQGAKRAKITGL